MIGKRVLARLQGKTLGACHKCGASLKRGRSCLRATHCVRCNTSYHTYDCGNRMAAVLLADNPAECPKVRSTSVSKKPARFCFVFLPSRQLSFRHSSLTRDMSPLPLIPPVGTRLVSQRLSLRVRTSRVSRQQEQSAEGKKAFVWRLDYYQERHRSIGKRRGTMKHRTLHPRREGRALFAYRTLTRFFRSQGWSGNCRLASRTSSNLRRDARRRFGVIVFGVATRVFFVAFEKEVRDLCGTPSGSFAKSSQDRRCDDGVFWVYR